MKFTISSKMTIRGRRWRWKLRARNGRILASGEAFNSEMACVDSVNLIRDGAAGADLEILP